MHVSLNLTNLYVKKLEQVYYNAIHKAVVHDEWHLYFSCCIYKHIPPRAFQASEIPFSTSSKGYLSWEEAPEKEVARVEESGREEKANQSIGIGREGGRADVGEGDSALLST